MLTIVPFWAALALAPFNSSRDCHTAVFAQQSTNWNQSVTVPQFDPALGTLTGIQVTFRARARGLFGIENLDAGAAQITSTFGATITLRDHASTPVVVLMPTVSFIDSLARFDGVIDFRGTSGVLHDNVVATGADGYQPSLTPANLAAFVGTGVVPFSASAVGTSLASGPGNLVSQFSTNANGTLDVCYLYFADCDHDGVSDADEIEAGAPDVYGPNGCAADGIPDACQPRPDCDGDGLPDECELASNDCDGNGTPDDCQPDCDGDGTADSCEILAGAIDRYGATTCAPDGVPDACQPQNDCDGDGTPDLCEIANGTSTDVDRNGIPDDCENFGVQGCTPGYWKNHASAWVPTGYAPAMDFDAVFGVNAFTPNRTLMYVAGQGGGGIKALGRHAVAALLSAAHPNVAYPISVTDVVTLVRNAVLSGDYEPTKNLLESYNELGCPL